MNRHYHVLLETKEPNRAQHMGWLESVFAWWINSQRRLRGHLFGARHKPILVELIESPLVVAFLLFPLIACSLAAEPSASDLQAFWTEFRTASLNRDAARLEALTEFPFKVRGTLDSDPGRNCDRSEFRSLVPKLLSLDTGLSEKPESMRELIGRTPEIADAPARQARGTFRLGVFVFQRVDKGWRFTAAYLEE